MNEIKFDAELDACGLNCPLPLLKAKQALNKLVLNQVLKVVCTDAGSVRDFEVFAKQSGNLLLASSSEFIESVETYRYWLKKA